MMDTSGLKSFAARARVDLLVQVAARLDVVVATGSSARVEFPGAVAALERAVTVEGRDSVIDRVAYTWFNRIVALRFMDANGYTSVGVVSPEGGAAVGQPQVLSDAKGGDFDPEVVNENTRVTVTALLNGTRPSVDPQGEAYALLLEAYCRFWNKAMPFMFEREGDYTELLIPTSLLAADSIRDRAVQILTPEVCSEVEVIGWLYQFYISDRKAEVYAFFDGGGRAGADEIPPATQLFTPDWIVRYLVENSVGRLWLLNHPQSRLAERMQYYVPPVDEDAEFLRIASPEDLTVMDPAAGSGHMLTYSFDLLYAIYEEESYSPSEIPSKILEHNLFGAEIDPRAGALAAFALTMKAAAKQKLFLRNPAPPRIRVMQNVRFEEDDLDYLWSLRTGSDTARRDLDKFWNAFEHADTYGSLITPNADILSAATQIVDRLEATGNLLADAARQVISQAEPLARRYASVVANPPYLGTRHMSDLLRAWARERYPSSAVDLCTMFIERGIDLLQPSGVAGIVASESWLGNVTFSGFRTMLLDRVSIASALWIDGAAFGVRLNTVAATFVGDLADRQTTYGRITRDLLPPSAVPDDLTAVRVSALRDLPIDALAFDLPPRALELYETEGLLGDRFRTKQGMATTDNKRFVRSWWEVSVSGIVRGATSSPADADWVPYNKGGTPTRWVGNREFVVRWRGQAAELKAAKAKGNMGDPFFFRASVSWSNIGKGGAKFRLYPAGYVFDIAGMSAFAPDDESALGLLGYLNAATTVATLEVLAPTLNYQVGDVARLPGVPAWDSAAIERIARLVGIAETVASSREVDPSFTGVPWQPGSLASWIAEGDRKDAERVATVATLEAENSAYWDPGYTAEPIGSNDVPDRVQDLMSYAVGCFFGRYSLDIPGLVLANQGDNLQQYLAKVPSPTLLPDSDAVIPIVDGEWFEDDIVAKFRQFLRVTFGEEQFEENLQFVKDSLGVKDLRDYFTRSFYQDHVQRYKKRPIYWLFSSSKGSFTALVYLHRYSPSTTSTVLNEYLREFMRKLEISLDQQERLVATATAARDIAAAQKEADRLRKVLIELTDYEHTLYGLAARQIPLDLDDGVLVNYQKLAPALRDIGLKRTSNDD